MRAFIILRKRPDHQTRFLPVTFNYGVSGATHGLKKKRKKENCATFQLKNVITIEAHAHSAKLCGKTLTFSSTVEPQYTYSSIINVLIFLNTLLYNTYFTSRTQIQYMYYPKYA